MASSSTLLDGAETLASVDTASEDHPATLLSDGSGQRFLLWEGPNGWARRLELLYGCDDLEALPRPLKRSLEAEKRTRLLLRCASDRVELFDIWKWRNLPAMRALRSLERLAQTVRTLHDAGFTLQGIRRNELLFEPGTGHLSLAALPRLAPSDNSHETIWRDLRLFGELAYENFLDHEYPGGHRLVEILQDRDTMAATGIVTAGLPQLLAGCVTPYGDLAYNSADELLRGLTHLKNELTRPLSFRVGSRSTQGNHIFRQNNQDSCGHIQLDTVCGSRPERMGFFCVADGIGGIQDGERASALAVKTASSAFLRAWNHYDEQAIKAAPVAFARAVAQVTSQRLAMEGDFAPHQNRGGTTFTGLLIAGGRAGICHVGDSRAMLIRKQRLIQLTLDHTLATILSRLEDEPTEAEENASQRTISRFFSTGAELEWSRIAGFADCVADALSISPAELHHRGLKVEPGDIFILTSDGAHGEVPDDDLLRLAATYAQDPQRLCEAIVDQALLQIGRDNATVVAVLVE